LKKRRRCLDALTSRYVYVYNIGLDTAMSSMRFVSRDMDAWHEWMTALQEERTQ
jgi:hypothetical protein